MKVVFDINIFVSAFVIPGGRAEEAILRIIEGRDTLILSKPILQKLLQTLSKKFGREAEELAHVAVFLSEISRFVEPGKKLTVLKDNPDNRVLECAISGTADIIVTGDKAILAIGTYKKTKILSLKEYLTNP